MCLLFSTHLQTAKKYLIWRHPLLLVMPPAASSFSSSSSRTSYINSKLEWLPKELSISGALFRFRYFLSSCVGGSQCIDAWFLLSLSKIYSSSGCWSCVFIPMELAPSSVFWRWEVQSQNEQRYISPETALPFLCPTPPPPRPSGAIT